MNADQILDHKIFELVSNLDTAPRTGDQWPTHRAKARAARLAHPTTTQEIDQ